MVVVGASHACKLSALLAASLETKFLKLPTQSQTPDAAEDLADELRSFALTANNVVYLDLLSNQVYLGTNDNGNSSEPFKDSQKKGTFQEAWWRRPNRVSEKCWTSSLLFGRPAVQQR